LFLTLRDNVIPNNPIVMNSDPEAQAAKTKFDDNTGLFPSTDVLFLYKQAHKYASLGLNFRIAGSVGFLFELKV